MQVCATLVCYWDYVSAYLDNDGEDVYKILLGLQ